MAGDIKQRIVLEGEKEYKQALKDATRNLKTLRSELKAETAELGRNASEKQKNAVKAKNLIQQIQEQEKAVRAHSEALEEVRKKYGDNEEAIAKYEQRLNDARTILANLKNEYDEIGDGARRSILENNALAESFTRIAETASTVSSAMENIFSGVVGTIKNAVSEIWAQLMDVAARANEWSDIATMWNTNAANIEKWYHAVRSQAKDFSTLSNQVTKIVTGDQKKIAEASGVSAEQYSDKWEYAMAVMDKLSGMQLDDAMKALETMDIKNARQEGWLDMLNSWKDIQGQLGRFDAENGGMGITDEDIQKANELSISVATIKESWMALKDNWMVHLFGDLALNITGNLQNILDGFNEYFNAKNDDERNAAIEKIKTNIREMFDAVRSAIEAGIKALNELATELKNTDDPTSQAIGNVLQGIADVIAWLADTENWEKIKKGFEIVFGAWLVTKVAALAASIGKIATSLTTIMGLKGASGLFGSAAASAAGGAAGGTGIAAALGALAVPVAGLTIAASMVYLSGKKIADINDSANKAREVKADETRYAALSEEQKAYLQGVVRFLQSENGGSANVAPMMLQLAQKMGPQLLDVFDYENTSGEKRNKLVDMLGMTEVEAAMAAAMMQAAGIDTSGMPGYDNALGKWKQFQQEGRTDWTSVYKTLAGPGGFWDLSGRFVNGKFTIPGMENYKPVTSSNVSAAPNPWELSGYANTTNKPTELKNWKTGYWVGDDWRGMTEKYVNIDQNGGTWNHGVDSSWWGKQTETNQKISDMKVSIDRLPGEIGRSLSNVKIIMDKETVGYIIAQEVSQQIARDVPMLN